MTPGQLIINHPFCFYPGLVSVTRPMCWAGWIMHGKIQRNRPATGNRLRIKFLESNSDRTNSHPAQGRGGFNRLSLSIIIAAPAMVPSSLSSEVYHSLHLIARLLLSLSVL